MAVQTDTREAQDPASLAGERIKGGLTASVLSVLVLTCVCRKSNPGRLDGKQAFYRPLNHKRVW
jgi:hypothetical protein